MAGWKPTIGKWNDEDNYDMNEPLWRRMLNAASEYEEIKNVQEVLTQLGRKNLTADDIRIYVIGYLLNQKNVDLKKYLWEDIISKIHTFSAQSKNIYDYTVFVMKECRVSDAVVEEFLDEVQATK